MPWPGTIPKPSTYSPTWLTIAPPSAFNRPSKQMKRFPAGGQAREESIAQRGERSCSAANQARIDPQGLMEKVSIREDARCSRFTAAGCDQSGRQDLNLRPPA